MIGRFLNWLHRVRHGHDPWWHVSGYDGLEVLYGCRNCDPAYNWHRWHGTEPCDCP